MFACSVVSASLSSLADVLLCFTHKSNTKKGHKKALEAYIFCLCIPSWLLCTVIIYSLSSWMFLALPLEWFAIINPAQRIRTFVTHIFNPPVELNNFNRPSFVSFLSLSLLTSDQNSATTAYCIKVPGQMQAESLISFSFISACQF